MNGPREWGGSCMARSGEIGAMEGIALARRVGVRAASSTPLLQKQLANPLDFFKGTVRLLGKISSWRKIQKVLKFEVNQIEGVFHLARDGSKLVENMFQLRLTKVRL